MERWIHIYAESLGLFWRCELYNGEIVFCIADAEEICVDFGPEMEPTQIVKKGTLVVSGRKAPKHMMRWKLQYIFALNLRK